jgi:ATP-binding cassette subfamily B protein
LNTSSSSRAPLDLSTDDAPAGTAKPARQSLAPLLKLAPYVTRHPKMMAAALIALLLSAAAMLAVPVAVRRVIDFGFEPGNEGLIDRYFAMLIVIGAALAVSAASRFYFVNWLGERVVANVRADVFKHLTTLGPAFFAKTQSGEVMSRLTADTTQIKSAAGSTLSQALRNAIMLFGALAMMFVTSATLSLIVIAIIPAIVFPLMAAGRGVQKKSRVAQDTLAESSAYAQENLTAVRTMQAYTNEGVVADRFRVATEASFEAARERLVSRGVLTAAAMFIVTASIVGVLWFGARWVIAGEITGGRLGQFVLYAVFAAGALAELAEVWGELNQAAGAAQRLSELLAEVPEIREPANPRALPTPSPGTIAFERVAFAYPDRRETAALQDITFKVGRGETVALVGPSGGGKSTMLSLILRFYDPSSGRVLVDGVPVSEAALGDLRGRVALVPQDVALFADTIAANIAYGTPGAPAERIEAAARAAHADGFIRALPQGYATRVGERGVTLSGGQRQRIAIARAILRDAPILLLDEATSALDAENEVAVQRALEGLMGQRTTLVIAHRLATVQRADRILVIDRGRIVEDGTHASLVARGGLYARLADLQFGQDAAE